MAVPVTQIGILRVLLQVQSNLSGLQKNMRDNAQTWRTVGHQVRSAMLKLDADTRAQAVAIYVTSK